LLVLRGGLHLEARVLRLQLLKSTAADLALSMHQLQHTVELLPFTPFMLNEQLLVVDSL
jgi:hypothetical protein